MPSKSEFLVRSSLTVLTLWAYLAFGNSIAGFILGHQPSNAELGYVAVGIFIASYAIGSLVIRGLRHPSEEA